MKIYKDGIEVTSQALVEELERMTKKTLGVDSPGMGNGLQAKFILACLEQGLIVVPGYEIK